MLVGPESNSLIEHLRLQKPLPSWALFFYCFTRLKFSLPKNVSYAPFSIWRGLEFKMVAFTTLSVFSDCYLLGFDGKGSLSDGGMIALSCNRYRD